MVLVRAVPGFLTSFSVAFLQCKELQGFIRPLTDLLNGLKMGRFERGNHPIDCVHSG